MRYVIYARKSTESADRQVQSIEDQLQAMRKVATKEGWTVTEELIETKSAKAPGTRPIFKQLLTDIERGRVQGLLTWSINRLARNALDGGHISHLLQTGKLDFIKTQDRLYLPEDSALLLAIEHGVATQDIQNLRKGVIRGMRGKVDRGWIPGKAPVGYINNKLLKVVEPDPNAYALVRKAWDLLLSGAHTAQDIHRLLVSWNVRTTETSPKPISRSHVHALFRNPFYCGKLRFNGELFPGKHEPMVSCEEFASAQRILRRQIDPRPSKHIFPYTGFIRHDCGCLVTAERHVKRYKSTGRTAEYTYYHCSGSTGCSKQSVSESFIEDAILLGLDSIHMSDEIADWCEWAYRELVPTMAELKESQLESLKAEKRNLVARLEKLLELRLNGEFDAGEYLKAKQTETAKLAVLEGQMEGFGNEHELGIRTLTETLSLARLNRQDFINAAPNVKRAYATAFGEKYLLTLKKNGPNLKIQTHPLIPVLAAFEALRDGSHKPKMHVPPPPNSVWWTFLDNVRTCLSHSWVRSCGEL